jgi:anti-anti-sigma factor
MRGGRVVTVDRQYRVDPGVDRGQPSTRTVRRDFSLAVSRALGMIVVTVHGGLNACSSGTLRRLLWDLTDQQGSSDVVVDLRDMTAEDGADLELFVDASHRARERGGHFTLSGPCRATAKAFARAGLANTVDVEPSGSHRPLYRTGGREA